MISSKNFRTALIVVSKSVAGFSRGGEKMASIEMAVPNVVHAKGDYWNCGVVTG